MTAPDKSDRPVPPNALAESILGMADVAAGWGRGVAASALRAAGEHMMTSSLPPLVPPHGLLTGLDLTGTAPALRRMHRLVYVSRATGRDATEADQHAAAILRVARMHNLGARLTGALVHSQAWFGQVLEGDLIEIERLYLRIARDPRNRDPRVLSLRPIRRRGFAAWSMASAGEAPDLLIRQALAALGDAARLDAVLRRMFILVRGRLRSA